MTEPDRTYKTKVLHLLDDEILCSVDHTDNVKCITYIHIDKILDGSYFTECNHPVLKEDCHINICLDCVSYHMGERSLVHSRLDIEYDSITHLEPKNPADNTTLCGFFPSELPEDHTTENIETTLPGHSHICNACDRARWDDTEVIIKDY